MFPCLPRLSLPPATASLASSAASASARPPALRPVGRVARFNTSQPSRSIDPHLPLFIYITDLLTATRRHSVLASWTDCRRCRRRPRYHACLLNFHHQQQHRIVPPLLHRQSLRLASCRQDRIYDGRTTKRSSSSSKERVRHSSAPTSYAFPLVSLFVYDLLTGRTKCSHR